MRWLQLSGLCQPSRFAVQACRFNVRQVAGAGESLWQKSSAVGQPIARYHDVQARRFSVRMAPAPSTSGQKAPG